MKMDDVFLMVGFLFFLLTKKFCDHKIISAQTVKLRISYN